MIKFTIITLFPEAVEAYLSCSMMWKAREKGLASYELVNLREYGLGPHKSVDDTPYGGGDGMLLRCEPVFAVVEEVLGRDPGAQVILPTPVGETWNQGWARKLVGMETDGRATATEIDGETPTIGIGNKAMATEIDDEASTMGAGNETVAIKTRDKLQGTRVEDRHYVILCPHYEGYDERILTLVDYKFSLGKFVLTGGEIPALAIVDSVVRLIPGVLGGEKSAEIESFSDGDNLEYPQYTKPSDFRGMKVPEVLLSGNHGEIAKWREEHSGKAGQA